MEDARYSGWLEQEWRATSSPVHQQSKIIKVLKCVVPEKKSIPSSLRKLQLNFTHFFKFVGLTESQPPPPHPTPPAQEVPIPSVGGVIDNFLEMYKVRTFHQTN